MVFVVTKIREEIVTTATFDHNDLEINFSFITSPVLERLLTNRQTDGQRRGAIISYWGLYLKIDHSKSKWMNPNYKLQYYHVGNIGYTEFWILLPLVVNVTTKLFTVNCMFSAPSELFFIKLDKWQE